MRTGMQTTGDLHRGSLESCLGGISLAGGQKSNQTFPGDIDVPTPRRFIERKANDVCRTTRVDAFHRVPRDMPRPGGPRSGSPGA